MTQLCRNSVLDILNRFPMDAHAGLLLAKGMTCEPEGKQKQEHIEKIARLNESDIYIEAFNRWKVTTSSFAHTEKALVGRLYIGVTRDNALETGITVSHTYGMPMIPGSAVKGLCRASASAWLKNKEASAYLFGNEPEETDEAKMEVGGLIFHDAWWIPEEGKKPFVPEVITVHHQEYYGGEGKQPATDFDSPVPAPQIATQGSFYFVIEGEPAWTKLAIRLLEKGLSERGIGSKTSSGYGFFVG